MRIEEDFIEIVSFEMGFEGCQSILGKDAQKDRIHYSNISDIFLQAEAREGQKVRISGVR